MTITSGSVMYGRTIKTGDFENAKAEVRFDFNVAEGADHSKVVASAAAQAHQKAHEMLGLKVDRVASTLAAVPPPPPPQAALPPPSSGLTPELAERRKPGRPPLTKNKPDPTPPPQDDPLGEVEMPAASDGLDDLLGEAPAVKEVSDKELQDAITACNARIKNATAIRALIGEFVPPPGRSASMEQSKRPDFIRKLNALKPATTA